MKTGQVSLETITKYIQALTFSEERYNIFLKKYKEQKNTKNNPLRFTEGIFLAGARARHEVYSSYLEYLDCTEIIRNIAKSYNNLHQVSLVK